MIDFRHTARSAVVRGALLIAVISIARLAGAQSICAPNGDGVVNDTDGCRAEFDGAVDACGGAFGGCPLIFF